MQNTQKNICSFGVLLLLALCAFSSTTVHAAPAAKKDWTMMVFLNGHNSLDSFGPLNINQMEKVGSTDKINMVVQWASMDQKTKRLYIQKDSDTANITSPVIQELPPVDMGDKNQLLEFIKWTHANYPADHYFVVVWDHGSGWHFVGQNPTMHTRDISSDDISGHQITTEQLGEVMVQAAAHIGRKIDVYASDACLMGMVEVAQEMAGGVNTFVGSQELEPGDGWPYDDFLSAWVANPTTDSNAVGKMLVDAYAKHYRETGDRTTTLSAFDMNELPGLIERIKEFRARLLSSPNLKSAQDAAKTATRFYYNDYADLGDVLTKLRTSQVSSEAFTELDALDTQLKKVVVANGTETAAHGLSIWWPTDSFDWSKYGARYKGLKFDQVTKWSDLMSALPK